MPPPSIVSASNTPCPTRHLGDASLWYPQVQITFKYFNPKTGEKIWKSVNVSHFVSPPPEPIKGRSYDKRSCRGEQFTVLFEQDADGNDSYTINANMDTDLQLAYTFTRPKGSAGWKLGAGPDGGKSYFGSKPSQPDGYVYHSFWPQATSSGHILIKGKAIDATGSGMFVHAIQGMRPNLVASRWNFANFQSTTADGESVAAIMMEFTTTSDYGGPVGSKVNKDETGKAVSKREPSIVNVGSVTVGGQLVAVTAATRGLHQAEAEPSRGSNSRVQHLDRTRDTETGYDVPQRLQYSWQGPLLEVTPTKTDADTANPVKAELSVDLGKPVPPAEAKGLVDKVDVLGEIPYMVRKMVNYVAGTKPYIYQVRSAGDSLGARVSMCKCMGSDALTYKLCRSDPADPPSAFFLLSNVCFTLPLLPRPPTVSEPGEPQAHSARVL